MDVPLGLVLGGGSLVHQVGRELNTAIERQLAPFDVTPQQAALLLHAGRTETSPSRLMSLLGTDTAGMTKLLDRLAAKGLVRRRHPTDRRGVVVEVTDAGRALLPPVFGRVTGQLLAGLSAADIERLTEMSQRMLANLRTGE